MTIETRNQKIEGTNLYVFSKDSTTGLFTYSRPMLAEEAKEVANRTNNAIAQEYQSANGLRGGLQVVEKDSLGSLKNMSTLKGIVANRELTAQTNKTVRFSTIQEGLLLHQAGLLPSVELMDFGIALYDANAPDNEIAEALCKTAGDKRFSLPILASFSSLGLNLGGKRYGVTPTLVSEEGLIRGKDAVATLGKFNYVGKSGVCRLYRGCSGSWSAGWSDCLDYFDVGCRVGRVTAVGSAKNLKELLEPQIAQNYTTKRNELQKRIVDINRQEAECITSAERALA